MRDANMDSLENLQKAFQELNKENHLNEALIEKFCELPEVQNYIQACLNFPIGNALIGALAAGWDLRKRVERLDAESKIVLLN